MDKKVFTVIIMIIIIGIGLIGVKIYSNITTTGTSNDTENINNMQEDFERKELTEEENTELMKAIENLEYTSESYNEYIESYLEDNKYVISVYRIFSDLTENSPTKSKNFYATYEDAQNEENVLFTTKTDEEFEQKLEEIEDNKKVKYIYTFIAKENSDSSKPNYSLLNYEIVDNRTGKDTYEDISNIEISVELDNEEEITYSEPLSIEKNDDVIKLLDIVIGAINSGEEYKTDTVGGFFEGSAILTIYQEDGTKLEVSAIDGFEPEGEKAVNIIGVWTKDDASDKILYEVDMEVDKYLNDLYDKYNK